MRKQLIDVEEVETIIAKMARIPAKQVSASDKDVLGHLERNSRWHLGQDPAIETLASAIKLACSGLANPTSRSATSSSPARPGWARPRSPRQLAMQLGIELVRFLICPST